MKKINVIIKILILLIIPILLIIYQAGITSNIFFSDPDCSYLLNGLSINICKLPVYADHPGVPLTELSAIGIRFIYWFSGHTCDIQTDVLLNPSYYEIRLRYILFYSIILLSFIIGYYIFKKSKSIHLAILYQIIPFLFDISIEIASTRFVPDVMVILFLQLFLLALFEFIIKIMQEKDIKREELLFPIICGFGLSIKLVILPIIVLPMLLIGHKVKNLIRFSFITIISFIFFTLPIIKQYPYLFKWISGLFLNSGAYGQGAKTIIDTSKYFNNILYIITNNTYMLALIVLSVIFLMLFIYWKLKKKNKYHIILFKVFLFSLITQIISIIIVAKSFYEGKNYYLIATYALTSLTFVIACIILTYQFNINNRMKTIFLFCFIVATIALNLQHYKNAYNGWAMTKNECNEVSDFVKKHSEYTIVTNNYNGLNKEFALLFGHAYSKVHKEKLMQLYPKAWFYNVFPGKFSFWDNEISTDSIFSKGKVLLIDTKLNEKEIKQLNDNGFDCNLLLSNRTKAIYELLKNDKIQKNKIFYDALIKAKINRIKKDEKWLALVKEKSLKQKVPLDTMILLDAKWTVDNFNGDYYQELINEKIKTIKEDDKWLNSIKDKAKKNKIPIDSMIYIDAKWMIDTYGY